MKILILTPLFPPDTGAPAQYVKTLASKLTSHDVTILLYGYLPESISNTNIISVDKRKWRTFKFLSFLSKIFSLAKKQDVIFVNNGLSTELPALFFSYLSKKPIILCNSDPLIKEDTSSKFYKIINSILKKKSSLIINLPADSTLYIPSEKLPFEKHNLKNTDEITKWWDKHLKEIESYE